MGDSFNQCWSAHDPPSDFAVNGLASEFHESGDDA
jgi:hypothetical protein